MSNSAITGPIFTDVRRSPSGSAAAPSWSFAESTGTGVYLVSAGVLGLSTNGAQRVVVDAAGNVGIGTASPSAPLQIVTSSNTINAAFGKPSFTTYQTDATVNLLGDHADGSGPSICFNHLNVGNNVATNQGCRIIGYRNNASSDRSMGLRFVYANGAGVSTEGMRLDAGGNLLVGTTSVLAGGQAPGLDVANNSGASTQIRFRNTGAAAGRYWRIGSDTGGTAYFINGNSTGVYISYGNTGWTGLSDERHKTDLKPIENAAVKVASLRAVTGRYKTDEEDKSRAFLIAQDVEKVLPEAVDTSNEERWGITYTDTIPLLVAAIQEQQEIIGKLEARLAALESK